MIRKREESSEDNRGSGGGEDSGTTSTPTNSTNGGSPTTTSTTSSPNKPSPARASPTDGSPTPPGIRSQDVLSTSAGRIVYVTTTEGRTETITTGSAQLTSSSSPPQEQAGSSGVSKGATAGIAIAVIVSVLLVAGLILLLYRRKGTPGRNSSYKWVETPSSATDSGSGSNQTPPESGEQTLQSLGYGGTAELHNNDKAVEASGRPVYEMVGSTPTDRQSGSWKALEAGVTLEHTPVASTPPMAGQEETMVSPIHFTSTTNASSLGGLVSPLEAGQWTFKYSNQI